MLRDRAATAGLTPALIADLLGLAPSSAYRALDREARDAAAIVAAWELMSPEQRIAWLAALGVDSGKRRRRGRPRLEATIAQNREYPSLELDRLSLEKRQHTLDTDGV